MAHETRSVGPLSTRAAVGSIDTKARTFEVMWGVGEKVLRSNWVDGPHWEELSMDPKHVRLERLNSGRAPFLPNHNGSDVAGVLGVIESARVEAGKGYAKVRFTPEGIDAEADKVFAKIAAGIIRSVSVGYRSHRVEKIATEGEKVPTLRAVDWTPYEISAVAMPADSTASIRSNSNAETNELVIVTRSNKESNMLRKKLMQEERSEGGGAQVDAEAARALELQNAATQERERISGIAHACRTAKLDASFGEGLIESGVTLDKARELVLNELARRSDEIPTDNHTHVEYGQRGDHNDFVRAATDALALRAGVKIGRPHAAARDLRNSSMFEIARTVLSRAGKSTRGLSNAQLIERAMTGDLPLVLTGSLRAALRSGYETEPSSHRLFVRVQSFQDYRTMERPILGSMPGLEEVPEGAEYKSGPFGEDGTSYRVTKFGRIVSLSDEVLKNDRFDAFLRLQPALGQAARRAEADAVYALFAEAAEAGPVMQDGVRLFDAAHGNVTAATSAITVASLGAARALLRKQTAVGGGYMNLAPKTLLVGADMETAAESILALSGRQLSATAETDVPKWIGGLDLAVEPRLPGTSFYVLGDPTQCDHVELGILDECLNGPVFEEFRDFSRDGTSFKVKHVFGVKVLDHRNIIRAPIS